MVFSDYSCKYFPYNGRSTGAYIIFFQGGTIDHGTHVPVPFAQSSAESEYDVECTAVRALENFRMLIHELLNKDIGIVPEEYPLIILDSKSDAFMANIGKDKNHTSNINRRVYFVINGEKCKMQQIFWCGGGLQLAYIVTKNVGENNLNPRMECIMLRLDN